MVEKVFREGRIVHSPVFSFRFFLSMGAARKISVISPRAVAAKAVKRNLLRRRGYKAVEKYLHEFPKGISGALVFKRPEEKLSILEDEVQNILHKIH